MVKARLIIKGNVQGVGFRVWASLFARRLGVGGLVRNLPDGSVESFVEGSRSAIESFMKKVSVRGKPEDPLSLHVEEIRVYWEGEREYKPAWREYKEFEIDYGAEEMRSSEKEMLESLEWSKLHFAGMSRVFREEFGDMKGVFRKELGDLKEGVRAVDSQVHNLRGDVKDVGSEVHELRDDVKSSFEEMAKRYDAISSELIRTREELTRAVNTLVELVKRFVREG